MDLHKLHLLLTLFPLLPLQVLKLGQSGASGPSVTCLHPATWSSDSATARTLHQLPPAVATPLRRLCALRSQPTNQHARIQAMQVVCQQGNSMIIMIWLFHRKHNEHLLCQLLWPCLHLLKPAEQRALLSAKQYSRDGHLWEGLQLCRTMFSTWGFPLSFGQLHRWP